MTSCDYDADLVEEALKTLWYDAKIKNKKRKEQPPTLCQFAGKFIYCEVMNVIEMAIYREHEICFYNMYQGCSEYPNTSRYFTFGSCQLISEFNPYYLGEDIKTDPLKLARVAMKLFEKLKEIERIDGKRAVAFTRENNYIKIIPHVKPLISIRLILYLM